MRSVLVTGATGAFGRAFVKRLLLDTAPDRPKTPIPPWHRDCYDNWHGGPERICIYSRDEHKQAVMRRELKDDPRLRFFIGDVRDADRLHTAMHGCDTVIHAAALKRIEVGQYNPTEMIRTNVLGAMNVVAAAADMGVARVVALSSDKAYQPVSPYGQSKALAESVFLSANTERAGCGTRYAVTRYGNCMGSTGSVIPTWRKILNDGDVVPVTSMDATRFFMTMDAAVDLVLNAAETMPDEPLIPALPAFRVGDLVEAMGITNYRVIGMPAFEKEHESMNAERCSATARRMSVDEIKEALKHV